MKLSDLVEITDSHFIVDLMYASTHHNMTKRAVYQEIGLGNHAFVHPDLWLCLQKLIPYLESTGQKLKIYDAYRPVSAHKLLFAAIPQDGFFISSPEQSPHCRAAAVDVALIASDGTELTYPTLVDAYDDKFSAEVLQGNLTGFFNYLKHASLDYQDSSIPQAIKNRDNLYNLMLSIGLVGVPRRHEWWHYELPLARTSHYPVIED